MLVIFDCDGVLVESEALAAKAYAQELAKYSIHLTPQACEALFLGKTTQDCLAILEQQYPNTTPKNFMTLVDEAAEVVFDQEMTAIPGVREVLEWIKTRSQPVCVATNGSSIKVTNSLRRTALTDFFAGNLFSADMVAAPKPAPDLYLLAAQSMGVAPDACVVIEDSEVGMTAALAAGMQVILYRPMWRHVYFQPPAVVRVIEDMGALTPLLGVMLTP